MTPADAQQLAAVTLTVVVASFAIGIGLYVWYSLMLAKVFGHFGLSSWSAWVPVYSQMQVFRLGGQNPWLALLLYVPFAQVVGLVFQVMALHRISTQYWRGVGTTVLGVLLPPVWATVLAAGASPDPERGRMPVRGPSTGAIPPVAPAGPLAASVAAVASGWSVPAGAAPAGAAPAGAAPAGATAIAVPPMSTPAGADRHAGDSAPILPAWADLRPRGDGPIPPAPGPIAAPAVVPGPRIPPATSAASVASVAPAADAGAPIAPPIGGQVPRIPGRIEPLPVMPVTSVADLNVDLNAGPDAGRDAQRFAPAAGQTLPTLPPVAPPVAPPIAPPVAPPITAPITAPTAVSEPTPSADDDLLDRTVVVARRPLVTWRLVTDAGEALRLVGAVVLLGRNPRAADAGTGEQRLVVPDPSRTLSKTHAVLRLDGEQWSITDLDSTNGVLVPDGEGIDRLIDPGVPTPVPDRFVLGTLSVRIERDPPAAGVPGR